MATTTTQPNSTIAEILHAIVLLGITAAGIFVKNPAHRQLAGSIVDATNQIVLPVADQLLNPPAAPTEPK